MERNYLIHFGKVLPQVPDGVFIAQGARVIGDVSVGNFSSIWFNSVIRGDINNIHIGSYSNIQDNGIVHVDGGHPCIVGDYVTVGHGVILHGCNIADNCLIGMGAILLNGAQIGENCIIGAGALVTENRVIPPNSLVIGSPGKVVRSISSEEIQAIRSSALHYYELSLSYYAIK